MSERQTDLFLDLVGRTAPVVLPLLRDEIAAAWGLPLGRRVEVCLKGGTRSAVSGVLELRSAPAYPWDARQVLELRIAGLHFTNREIGQWTLL